MLSVLFPESKEWHLSLQPNGSFTTPRLQIRSTEATTLRSLRRCNSERVEVIFEEKAMNWSLFVSQRVSGYPGRQKAMQFIYRLFGNEAIDEVCSPPPPDMLLSPLAAHNATQIHVPSSLRPALDVSFLGEALRHYIAHYQPSSAAIELVRKHVREQMKFIDEELALLASIRDRP